jgi:hypothetical protein
MVASGPSRIVPSEMALTTSGLFNKLDAEFSANEFAGPAGFFKGFVMGVVRRERRNHRCRLSI